MSTLRFQIQHSNGRQEVVNVEAERALIGSGAHCEIRLPIDQAQVEHILVQVGTGGIFVQALSFEPSPTIASVPFTQAPLPPDAVLGVNGTQMLVALSDAGAGAGRGPEKKTNPMIVIAGLAGIGLAGYMFLSTEDEGPSVAPQESPALWDPAPITCSRGGVEAKSWADEKRSLADSKRGRRMFHARDGVDAVPLYDEAAACYEKGGDPSTAGMMRDLSKELRKETEDDYKTHRMRLEHARTVGDLETARKEVKVLLEMTAGKQGPYIEYLNQLDRELRQKLGRPS